MTPKTLWLIVILVIIAGILLWQNQQLRPDREKEIIKIGVVLPFTGKLAQYGEEAKRGIELASEQAKGVQLEILYEDSKSEVKEGVSSYQRLKIANIPIVITGSSNISLAISPLTNQDKVIQMAVFSSIADYTSANDFTFRTTSRSELENKKLASWIIVHGYQKIAIIATNDSWGKGHYNVIKPEIEKLGGKILVDELFLRTDNDFRTQLSKIKNQNPEAVIVIAEGKNAGMILNQANELKLEKQIFGVRAVESVDMLEVAKENAEGLIYPYSFDEKSTEPKISQFVSQYKAKYGILPTAYVAEGYDAMNLILKAIKNCNGVQDTNCFKTDLLATKDFPGVLGSLTFDENGDVVLSFFMKQVKNGQFIKYEE